MNKVTLVETTPTKKPHKRFIVYGYADHYPAGGIHDEIHSADSLGEAIDFLRISETSWDTYEVYDRKTGQIWSATVERILDDSDTPN